jgi:hypothetical protein
MYNLSGEARRPWRVWGVGPLPALNVDLCTHGPAGIFNDRGADHSTYAQEDLLEEDLLDRAITCP